MLSRVADSIYWMARYMERAENISRLLLSTQDLLLDAGAEAADPSQFWDSLLKATGDHEACRDDAAPFSGDQVAAFLTLRQDNPNSMLNSVRAARENARTVRDQISNELWECVNSLRLFLESPAARTMQQQQPAAFYERVLQNSYQFQGVAASTIPQGEARQFLRLGTALERADKASRLLDTCSGLSMEMAPHPASRPLRWAALLRSASAWHAFQTLSARLDPVKIVEYLLLETAFPRSIACCVKDVHDTLLSIGRKWPAGDISTPLRLSGKLAADIRYCSLNDILEPGLHAFIDDFQKRLNAVGSAIFETFVLYAGGATPDGHPQRFAPARSGAWHTTDETGIIIQQQQQQQ